MKVMRLVSILIGVSIATTCICGGRTVTDGFESQFVPRSPDNEDPNDCRRLFDVYLPEAFDTDPDQTFPIVYHLTGLGGNFATYSIPDRLVMDRMIENGEVMPMIIVAPDPRVLNYDGSFWVDSTLVDSPSETFNGLFERYIVEELIPFVDAKYRQKTTAAGESAPFRAIMGQSMGGYGSLFYGVKHPELFSAFAGDSPTAFWLIASDLASPNVSPHPSMYSFNKLLIPELQGGQISPQNGDVTFGFYSWAGAFSPVSPGSAFCSLEPPACTSQAPFCVAYPFEVTVTDTTVEPTLVANTSNIDCTPAPDPLPPDQSFVPNEAILARWRTFDPFDLLDQADPEVLKRQAIYLDAGADLDREPVDNVGARFFSDKLTSFDINNEYLLFDGGHISCTTVQELECYRFTTNLKLFSGKFSEAGIFATDVRTRLVGDLTIELAGTSVMSINDKALLGVETDPDMSGVTTTNVTINVLQDARLEIGTEEIIGGGFQVGNPFGKANILNNPSRATNTINFTLVINGPGATVQIGRQGYLGFGVGIDGNQTALPNFWALSTLTNVASVSLHLMQGQLLHQQIANSLDPKGALIAIGPISTVDTQDGQGYSFTIDPVMSTLAGGGNLATMIESNRIHPTVQDVAGSINPGGIRNRIAVVSPDAIDKFYGCPNGTYGSQTFSRNEMMVGIVSSSAMLFDRNKEQLPLDADATRQQLFDFLKVDNYLEQGKKRAPINDLEQQVTTGFLARDAEIPVSIKRPIVDEADPCNPLSDDFDVDKIVKEGAVGIKIATIDGKPTVIRLYDLDPDVG